VNYPAQPQPPYAPQGQPGYTQPGYPQAQPQYAPPPVPAYQPPPAYVPTPPPGYPNQPQYAPQPGYPQPPAPVPARATLGEFMDQPSGGGTAITKYFKGRPQGTWLQLRVSRDLVPSDVQHQADNAGVLQYFKTGGQPDPGKPKLVLVVKTDLVSASDPAAAGAVFADGTASVWLKGVTRDALVAAIGAAGLPEPSKILQSGKIGGAVITMVSAGERPSSNPMFSATKLYDFTYQPGGREMEAFQPAPQAPAPALPDTAQQYQQQATQLQQIAQQASGFPAPPPATAPPPAPTYGTAPGPAPAVAPSPVTVQYAPPQQLPPTAPPAPPAAAYPPPVPALGTVAMDEEMRATLARLHGQG
jgi:hypothetical protein